MVETIKVLLAVNSEVDADWLKSSLQEISMETIQIKTFLALEEMLAPQKGDVLILSLTLPDSPGTDCIQKAKSICPDIPIVVSVPADAEMEAYKGVQCGAQGFIRIGTVGPYSLAAIIQQALQRQKTIIQIRESQRQLANLVKNLSGFVYRCRNDAYWTMEYVSEGCKQLTGYDSSDFIQNSKISYEEIVHPEDRKRIRIEIHNAIENKTNFQVEYRIQTAQKEEKWVWEQGNVIDFCKPVENTKIEGFVTDITEKKLREFQMQTIIKVGAVMRDAIRTKDFSQCLIDKIRDLYQTDCVALLITTNQPGMLYMDSAMGVWEKFIDKKVDFVDCVGFSSIHENKIIQFDREKNKGKICHAIDCSVNRFMLFIPLSAQRKKTGLIVAGREKRFTSQDIEVFEAIADMVASTIERTNLYQKTEKQLRRMESLHAIDQAITSVYEIKVINRIILDQVRKELDADAADILILNTVSNMLEYKGTSGFVDRDLGLYRVPLTTSVAGSVLLENKSKSIPDLEEEPLPFIRKNMRVENFKAYYAKPLSNKGVVVGIMEIFFRNPFYPDEEWENFFEAIATQAAVAYDSYRKYADLQKAQQNIASSFRSTLETWSKSLELHNIESHDHIQRVTNTTIRLARELGVDEEDLPKIERGALLHDIGKIGIMDDILQKKGKLTENEWKEIKRHPQIARDLLNNVKLLEDAVDIPYSHHENWDGSGYPQGLKGKEIPLAARIFAVVETFDALTSPRLYRKAWTRQATIDYLREQKGKKFDPVIVDKYLSKILKP